MALSPHFLKFPYRSSISIYLPFVHRKCIQKSRPPIVHITIMPGCFFYLPSRSSCDSIYRGSLASCAASSALKRFAMEVSMKIVLQNITKTFPSRGKKNTEDVVAVNDFTFEIPDGKAHWPTGSFGLRQKHHAQHDLRSRKTNRRPSVFWRSRRNGFTR